MSDDSVLLCEVFAEKILLLCDLVQLTRPQVSEEDIAAILMIEKKNKGKTIERGHRPNSLRHV
jgi:hypothetical protein